MIDSLQGGSHAAKQDTRPLDRAGQGQINLILGLARKLGCRHTIARVRNPEYNNQLRFLREELGLSMTINPERFSAGAVRGGAAELAGPRASKQSHRSAQGHAAGWTRRTG